jgi:hypothetical protein
VNKVKFRRRVESRKGEKVEVVVVVEEKLLAVAVTDL